MEVLLWFWIWIVLAAILAVCEMLTVSFFMLPFAIGAGVAAIASLCSAPLWLQFGLLIAVSVIALIALRPLANHISRTNSEKAGAERLVDSTGVVIVGGNYEKYEFRVLVQRDEWNALCEDASLLPVGTEIVVLRVEGAHLVVRSCQSDGKSGE